MSDLFTAFMNKCLMADGPGAMSSVPVGIIFSFDPPPPHMVGNFMTPEEDYLKRVAVAHDRPITTELIELGYDTNRSFVNGLDVEFTATGTGRIQYVALSVERKTDDGPMICYVAALDPFTIKAWQQVIIKSGKIRFGGDDQRDEPSMPPPGWHTGMGSVHGHTSASGMSHLASYVPPPDFKINWAEVDRRHPEEHALGNLRCYEHLEPGSLRFMVSSGTEWLHVEDVSERALRADDAPRLRNEITVLAKAALKNAYNHGRIKTAWNGTNMNTVPI